MKPNAQRQNTTPTLGMAAHVAAAYPQQCLALVTESAQTLVEDRTLEGIRAAQRAFEDSAQFARLTRWHGERARWVLDAWTQVWLSPAFRHWSLGEHLGRITCPVLALHGDADEYGSSACPRAIVEGVGGPAQMALLANCGHMPHREHESTVLAQLQAFLATHQVP